MNNRPTLPEIFPDGEVVVGNEQHIFETNEGSGGTIEITEYTLNKAPIITIKEVTGVNRGGNTVTFSNGRDYRLSNDKERLVWIDGAEQLPAYGSTFYVTYKADSIIKRYLDSSERELDSVDEQLTEVINSKFIDRADGSELDELGKLFGDPIGKRQGRDDEAYSVYLKSVVQSFISRGTVNGIKLAVSAATGLAVEDITIEEDFTKNEYSVVINPTTSVRGDIIEQVAEIADPSGVELLKSRFSTPPEKTIIDDGGVFSPVDGTTSDGMTVADAFPHDGGTSPLNPIDAAVSDSASADDTAVLNAVDASTTDTMTADETVAITSTSAVWGGDWDTLNWSVSHN